MRGCMGGPQSGRIMQSGFNKLKMAEQNGLTLMLSKSSAELLFDMLLPQRPGPNRLVQPPTKKVPDSRNSTKVMVKPGTNACSAINDVSCTRQEDHPQELHICAYCLSSVN